LKLFFEKTNDIYDFSGLKQIILEINEKLLDECFQHFMRLIISKDEKAWNLLCNGIKIRIYRFLRMEGYSQVNNFEEILQESLIVFTEKLELGNLEFVNSNKLKSFIIRIAQLKLYEKFRVSKKQKDLLRIDEVNYNLPELGSCQEVFENGEYVAYLFKKLEKKEQLIIYYFFFEQKQLKEIAEKINISEENCRVIKYRTIRKLRKIVGQNKEMQILN
jgi:RNA polymerase sigma factor (sigma-70 family)